MFIEIGGYDRGVDYDAIDVGGDLIFGGTLSIVFLDGFAPLTGDTFGLFSVAGTYNPKSSFSNILFSGGNYQGTFDHSTDDSRSTSFPNPQPTPQPSEH